MTATVIQYSQEETLKIIAERAKTSTDAFQIRISRRDGAMKLAQQIATVRSATVEHIANPETWLPVLCGGGDFVFAVSHHDDIANRIGGVLTFQFMSIPKAAQVRREAMKSDAWEGPGELVFPAATATGLPEGNAGGMFAGVPLPPVFPSQGAPQVQGQPVQGQPGQPQVMYDSQREYQLRQQEKELEERRARAEREQLQKEHELKERERDAKMEAKLEALRRESEAKLAAQQNSSTGTKDIVTGLIAAAVPLVTALLNSSQQARADSLRQQEESAKRQQEANNQMLALIMKMGEKKDGPDPAVSMALEMMKNSVSNNADMMSHMVTAMSTVSQTSVGMIQAIADLQIGDDPGNPILEAVKEGAKAIATLSKGAEGGARKVVAQQKVAAGGAQQSMPVPTPAPQALPAHPTPPRPQAVHQAQVAPPPNMSPSAAAEAQAFNEAPEAVFVPVDGHVIETLKALIEARYEPVDAVATFFVDSTSTKEMRAELDKVEGSIEGLFMKHLGAWATAEAANIEYVTRLGTSVTELGAARGLLSDEEDEELDA